MAEKTFKERRREKEREESRKSSETNTGSIELDQSSEILDQLIKKAEPLLNQVNSLYQQYFAGVEALPPVEQRRMLEKTLDKIASTSKNTPSQRFRAENFRATFTAHRERWDRLLKDLESGKMRRTVQAKRK